MLALQKSKSKPKAKPRGQECPRYTSKTKISSFTAIFRLAMGGGLFSIFGDFIFGLF
jgi:hypothetical protein